MYNYSPTEAQWWITGFDPLVQNVKSDELKAVTVIDFSSYGENAKLFYDSFREANSGNSEWIFSVILKSPRFNRLIILARDPKSK